MNLLILMLLVAVGLREFPVILHVGQLGEVQELRNQILSGDAAIAKMTAQIEAEYKTHRSKMGELESWFQSHADINSELGLDMCDERG